VHEVAEKLATKLAEREAKARDKPKGRGGAKLAPLGPAPRIIDEDGLFEIIRATSHLAPPAAAAPRGAAQGPQAAGGGGGPAAGGSGGGAPAPLGGASFFGDGGSGGGRPAGAKAQQGSPHVKAEPGASRAQPGAATPAAPGPCGPRRTARPARRARRACGRWALAFGARAALHGAPAA
jgi:hypothetical protein